MGADGGVFGGGQWWGEENMVDFIPSGTPGEAVVLLGQMKLFA